MLRFGDKANLWFLIAPPTIWALHFLFCYVTAAVICAKSGLSADLRPIQIAIGAATVVAALLIVAAGWKAYRHWRPSSELPPYDDPSDDDREQFLGISTFLLSCLSLVGVVFVALPALFIADCR
ncbi:hypothetical protein [Geminicoccus harenae]|uniref:hypothetical protein n=1 Tax=Geminicoccus harenae TaxID=2498453 RepID=UPI001CC317E9|nr:hypothetical protein [Geminicoccus harenae]